MNVRGPGLDGLLVVDRGIQLFSEHRRVDLLLLVCEESRLDLVDARIGTKLKLGFGGG